KDRECSQEPIYRWRTISARSCDFVVSKSSVGSYIFSSGFYGGAQFPGRSSESCSQLRDAQESQRSTGRLCAPENRAFRWRLDRKDERSVRHARNRAGSTHHRDASRESARDSAQLS